MNFIFPGPRRGKRSALVAALFSLSAFAASAGAQTPTASVPDPAESGVTFRYERQRIKRTVPTDPASGALLAERWDRLYATGEGASRRTAYLDWDDDFLYVALESPAWENVRVDLDAKGDGWFRGADNVAIEVSAPGGALAAIGGKVTTARWDTVQNRERPVWAQSPIPPSAIRAAWGRTPGGTFAVVLVIGRTEAAGLTRRPGAAFGLRTSWGEPPALSPDASGALPPTSFAPRALLPLTLADTVAGGDAAGAGAGAGIIARVSVAPRQVVLGTDTVRATLSVKNEGKTRARVTRLFLRGSQNSQPHLDAATYTGQELSPGETIRRDFVMSVAPGAGLGALVITGGADVENAATVSGLAAFDRVEPYTLMLTLDERPVTPKSAPPSAATAGTSVTYEKRDAVVTLASRATQRGEAEVALELPAGWGLEGGDRKRRIRLPFASEARTLRYHVLIPPSAAPGAYPIRVTVQAGERTYSASANVAVVAAAPARP